MNQNDKERIAELINSVLVWRNSANNALNRNDLDCYEKTTTWEYEAIVALHDEFGITLSVYDICAKWLADHKEDAA